MRLGPDRTAAAFLERLIHIWMRYLQRRNQREDERAKNRGDEGERKDRPVDCDVAHPRNVLWTEHTKQINAPPGDHQSGNRASKSENETFQQQLSDNASAARAQCRSNGNLTLPRRS